MAADPHNHGTTHTHDRPVTVVEERDTGIGGVVAALLVAAVLGFLIWLVAFSGAVFDSNDGGGAQITNEQQVDGGGTTTDGTTGGDTTGGDTSGDTSGTTGDTTGGSTP